VVATPIGNLEDVTARCKRVLSEVDVVAAEDTRRTKILLASLGITGKQLVTYADHNEAKVAEQLVERCLKEGLKIALVSDAGTPAIADPGYRLVRAGHRAGIRIEPVPGPCAMAALISASGLASDRFTFVGFLPPKGLVKAVEAWRVLSGSIVGYVPMRSLNSALVAMQTVFPTATIAIGRELTKMHEEIKVCSLPDALIWLESETTQRGEVTFMLELPADASAPADPKALQKDLKKRLKGGATVKDLLGEFRDCGLSRKELYQLLLKLSAGEPD
jgi:16S rRNA (cytidine1402-2'-O)-methyltransferase